MPFQTESKALPLLAFALISIMSFGSCHKDQEPVFAEAQVDLVSHQLATYYYTKNSEFLVVFESGLGDDHTVWNNHALAAQVASSVDVLMYDRAGYGNSGDNLDPRNIDKLRSELETIIDSRANGRKVILVGHSLGGMIIRDYAIKNPTKTAALLFLDASHELYNHPTQGQEDTIYNIFNDAYGAGFGGTLEARELVEDSQYMSLLPNLPNIPIVALTSMRTDADHDAADRQLWYDSKEALRAGVTDFTHITTTHSGHYIMIDEPNLVLDNIQLLLSKL